MARVWKFGKDVDTDQIVPGRYAPYMTSEAELGQYPFIEARPEFAKEVQPGDIIVAGENLGCGSSREYAPQALKIVGIAAIIAPSFARIFFRNALNLGLPLVEAPQVAEALQDGEQVEVDLREGKVVSAHGTYGLPKPRGFVEQIWQAGGIVPYFKQHGRFPGEQS
jgi:methanogen homoaconitase small subunit